MTAVSLAPMLMLGVLSETSASACSTVIVALTALVYLAMLCSPFWRESGTKPPEPKQAEDAFIEEKRNENCVTN